VYQDNKLEMSRAFPGGRRCTAHLLMTVPGV